MLEELRAATDHERDASFRRRASAWRTIHSLTGIGPVGLFLVGHLWTQLAALQGHRAYDEARAGIFDSRWLELVLVALPLTFHAGFGIVLALRSRNNVEAYPLTRNWMYVAQRVTGLVTFAFIVWHVAHLWAPQLSGELGPHQMYPKLEEDLSTTSGGFPIQAAATVVGVGAASFHLANGTWSFALSAGLVRSRSRQTALGAATVVLGILLFLAGTDAVVYFATGARMAPIRSGPAASDPKRRTTSDERSRASNGRPVPAVAPDASTAPRRPR